MTRDEDTLDPKLFDRRIVERHIKRGLITRKDYDKYLKSLSDAADKLRPVEEPHEAPSSSEGNEPVPPTT
jgi:hypothetical protein